MDHLKAYIWYLPPAVFGLWGLLWYWRHPRFLRDPTIVRHPQKQVWHLGRLLDDAEWTAEGRTVRRQFLRHLGMGVLLALSAIAMASYLEGKL